MDESPASDQKVDYIEKNGQRARELEVPVLVLEQKVELLEN